MSTDRYAKVVGLLLVAIVVGGCGTTERGGQSSGPSVSIGTRSASSDALPTRTARPATPTRIASVSTVTARPTTTQATVTTPVASTSASYTQEEIDYFLKVALGSEYGDSQQTIKKWEEDIRIDVLGTPNEQDLQTLEDVVREINGLIDEVKMVVVEQNPNVELHFAPEDDFGSIEPNYMPVNYGL